jgi:hypothetical protein
VPAYRIYFRNRAGVIAGRDDFDAADDAQASVIAAILCAACSDVFSDFDLWHGVRRIDPAAPRAMDSSANRVSTEVQAIVLQRELAMRDSRCNVAKCYASGIGRGGS